MVLIKRHQILLVAFFVLAGWHLRNQDANLLLLIVIFAIAPSRIQKNS